MAFALPSIHRLTQADKYQNGVVSRSVSWIHSGGKSLESQPSHELYRSHRRLLHLSAPASTLIDSVTLVVHSMTDKNPSVFVSAHSCRFGCVCWCLLLRINQEPWEFYLMAEGLKPDGSALPRAWPDTPLPVLVNPAHKAMSMKADCFMGICWPNYVYWDRRSWWQPTLHLSNSEKQSDFSGPCSNFSSHTWTFRLARQWCASNQSTLLRTVSRCPAGDQFHTWSQWPQGMPWASRFALLLSVHCRSISTNASRIQLHWIAGSDMYKRAR